MKFQDGKDFLNLSKEKNNNKNEFMTYMMNKKSIWGDNLDLSKMLTPCVPFPKNNTFLFP